MESHYLPVPNKLFKTAGAQNLFELYLIKNLGANAQFSNNKTTPLLSHPAIFDTYSGKSIMLEDLVHNCSKEANPVQVYQFEETKKGMKMIAPRIFCKTCNHLFESPTYLSDFYLNSEKLNPENVKFWKWSWIGNNNRAISELMLYEIFDLPEFKGFSLSKNTIDAFMSQSDSSKFIFPLESQNLISRKRAKIVPPISDSEPATLYSLTDAGNKRKKELRIKAEEISLANMIKFFAKERLDLISEKGIISGYLLNESGNYITGEVETEKTDLIHIKRKEVKQILSDDYDFFWKVRNSLRKAETPFSWEDFKIFER